MTLSLHQVGVVKKSKIFYGQEPPSGELLPQNVGSIINYLQ